MIGLLPAVRALKHVQASLLQNGHLPLQNVLADALQSS
jgi:hypothetical protein